MDNIFLSCCQLLDRTPGKPLGEHLEVPTTESGQVAPVTHWEHTGDRASHLSKVVTGAIIYFRSPKRPFDLYSFSCVWEWDYAHCVGECNLPLLVRTSVGAHVLAHALLTVRASTGSLKRLTAQMVRPRLAGQEPQNPRPGSPEPQELNPNPTMLPTQSLVCI
uniref:Uncharacterized protein n=1 Tax=Timema monikensis TaxID=170555 RepID=A0A7R9E214_9NEOP|nr:unnamed protein product [Timema monikensis]